MSATLTTRPSANDFRALARSSPWLFSTLHWRHGDVEAWLDRRAGRVTVRRADGLVRSRPSGWHYEHGDPMWGSYLWTAMLDPVELADGTDPEGGRPAQDVTGSWSAWTCGPGSSWTCPRSTALVARV